ncbi:GNAT family N-acetyltransferase [Vreelandella rituensis]|uniref:GNAT family N-acetyltransferase n=1 Tax=Vreelandella rituensis TaxID=2282306 RepID=A0A368U7C9_9GAMM|nr:GNAT family N-acetyltransferase [Halomonas rituensis]RCV92885.1 GNAT family N-acetyltransferase [Halomonas rituensis]
MITELSPEHLEALLALEAEAGSGASANQLATALADADCRLIGVWQGTQLGGYALLARLPFDAELQALGVSPLHRRKGLGQGLLEEVTSIAKAWQSERLLLEVRAGNTAAVTLYHRCGFQLDGRRKGYYSSRSGREDALLMSRVLLPMAPNLL